MRTLDTVVADSPIFASLTLEQIELIAGCASNTRFQAGEYLFREGDPADTFYLIRHGSVALETYVPGRGAVTIETIHEDEVVGWSWLFPPYKWHFDARAVGLVGALAFDGACLRGKCEGDHDLGYELHRRFEAVLIDRLQATRLRLLDLYGSVGGA